MTCASAVPIRAPAGTSPGSARRQARRRESEREDYDEVLALQLRRALDAGGGLRTLYLIEDLDD